MQPTSPAHFAIAIQAIEMDLGVQYPLDAPNFFQTLSTIATTSTHHRVFKTSRLLLTAKEVAAECDELGNRLFDGYILPFIRYERGEWPDIYGFDLKDTSRIVVFCAYDRSRLGGPAAIS